MNRLTTHLHLRAFSAMQWIMLVAIVTITSFMALATKAEAATAYLNQFPHAQTISHCGFLENRNKIYASYRAKSHQTRNTKIIQAKLQKAGFDIGHKGVDGIYGKHTRSAVANFQTRYALKRDGIAGTETIGALAYVTHPHENVRRCNSAARFR